MCARNPNQGMNWIRQTKRLAIYMRDGLACAYCGESVEAGAKLTLDHLVPNSKGGSNSETNLVTACHRCNSSRGTRSVRDFCRSVSDYLNNGQTAVIIERHVRNCKRRMIDVEAAKTIIDRRGSFAAVLKAD